MYHTQYTMQISNFSNLPHLSVVHVPRCHYCDVTVTLMDAAAGQVSTLTN